MIDRVKDYIKENEFRLTLFTNRVHMINYQEIISLESRRVSVLVEGKRMVLKGSNLTVTKLLDREILIQGEVRSLEWME